MNNNIYSGVDANAAFKHMNLQNNDAIAKNLGERLFRKHIAPTLYFM